MEVERERALPLGNTDEPVGAAATQRGVGQAIEVGLWPQLREARADGAVGEGRNPQALHRAPTARGLGDETEDELAFTPGVGGADDLRHVGSRERAPHHRELRRCCKGRGWCPTTLEVATPVAMKIVAVPPGPPCPLPGFAVCSSYAFGVMGPPATPVFTGMTQYELLEAFKAAGAKLGPAPEAGGTVSRSARRCGR